MTRISLLFDKAIEKLEAQGVRSYDEERDVCKYRDGRGNSCLFGHMISDEHYNEDFEGRGITDYDGITSAIQKTTGVDLTEYFTKYELNDLQGVHDYIWDVTENFKDCIPVHLQQKIWGE